MFRVTCVTFNGWFLGFAPASDVFYLVPSSDVYLPFFAKVR